MGDSSVAPVAVYFNTLQCLYPRQAKWGEVSSSSLQAGKQHSANPQVQNAFHDHVEGREEAISDGQMFIEISVMERCWHKGIESDALAWIGVSSWCVIFKIKNKAFTFHVSIDGIGSKYSLSLKRTVPWTVRKAVLWP